VAGRCRRGWLCCEGAGVDARTTAGQETGGTKWFLCHILCHNPLIPARVGPSPVVSLRYTQKAANRPETRMNTASLCRLVSLSICPCSFGLGNGMEEVIGSIPISTCPPRPFMKAQRPGEYLKNCLQRAKKRGSRMPVDASIEGSTS
jgi:hypothetical protein